MVIVIGELVNATRKSIGQAIENKDESFIRKIVEKQKKNGADYIDLNAGTGKGSKREHEDMRWLIEIVNALGAPPVCIDSSDPFVIRECLPMIKNKDIMINSINGEKSRIEDLMPVIKENPGCKVVALTMDDDGIPAGVGKRLEITQTLVELLDKAGVKQEDIFVDALVQPVSVDANNGVVFLESIAGITSKFPKIHKTCGLSNVSFGLPDRKLLNKYFLAISISYGLDSIIADPVDKGIQEAVCIGEALANKDEFCMNYITMCRKCSV